jgi:oxygen-independent coproporphyrinogen-3 oxidase
MRGNLATARGRALTDDDRFRGEIIERLMCDLYVDLEEVAERHGRALATLKDEFVALSSLAEDGLVVIDDACLFVPDSMRAGVRLVCAVFDKYLAPSQARHAVAV